MSENEMIHKTASDEMAGRLAGGVSERGPHLGQPHVLARVPELRSAEAERERETSASPGEGRLLSSPLSFKILMAAGAVLVLAAVVPLLFGKMFTSGSSSSENPSAWQPEPPAPGADVAPTWDRPTGGPSNWQAGPNGSNLPVAETPTGPAWNGQGDVAGGAGLPYRAAWNDQPQGSPVGNQDPSAAWNDQPQGSPVGNQDPSAAWNEPPQDPSWQVPEYGQPGQTRPAGSPWADSTRSPAGIADPRQIAPPQTGPTAQRGMQGVPSMYTPPRYEAARPAPAGTPAYGSDYGQSSQPVYRAADTRGSARAATSPYAYQADPQYGTQADARYGTQADPQYGNQADSRYGTQTDARYGTQADARYGTQADPQYGSQADSQYRPEPPNSYPTTGYSPTDPYVPALPAPSYGAGASSQGVEPGAAQFEGVIERPNAGTTYDRARSSLY